MNMRQLIIHFFRGPCYRGSHQPCRGHVAEGKEQVQISLWTNEQSYDSRLPCRIYVVPKIQREHILSFLASSCNGLVCSVSYIFAYIIPTLDVVMHSSLCNFRILNLSPHSVFSLYTTAKVLCLLIHVVFKTCSLPYEDLSLSQNRYRFDITIAFTPKYALVKICHMQSLHSPPNMLQLRFVICSY